MKGLRNPERIPILRKGVHNWRARQARGPAWCTSRTSTSHTDQDPPPRLSSLVSGVSAPQRGLPHATARRDLLTAAAPEDDAGDGLRGLRGGKETYTHHGGLQNHLRPSAQRVHVHVAAPCAAQSSVMHTCQMCARQRWRLHGDVSKQCSAADATLSINPRFGSPAVQVASWNVGQPQALLTGTLRCRRVSTCILTGNGATEPHGQAGSVGYRGT